MIKLYKQDLEQSIRFSGYNNEENSFAPSIIIRNRQGSKSVNDLKIGDFLEENFIDDGSTIAYNKW